MIIQWGNYSHGLCEAGVAVTREVLRSTDMVPYILKERWDIDGQLFGDDSADVSDLAAEMEEAYGKDGKDLKWFLPNGTTLFRSMLTKEAIGGTFVVKPVSFPDNGRNNAEGTTWRTYSLAVEASFPLSKPGLLSYSETVNIQGTGGPRWVYFPVLRGQPIRQMVQQKTTIKAVQSGSAKGAFEYPLPGSPMNPGAEHEEMRSIVRTKPKRIGTTGETDFEVSWSYQFEYLR